jgi:hypothetical protein
MRTILLAAGAVLAALSATATAQGDAPAASGAACYIEVRQLMADPPAGIGDLGAAIRALDVALRPQVTEINALKARLARLEQREAQPAPSTSAEAAFAEDDSAPPPAAPPADDRTAEEIRGVRAELEAKQAQLKLDYAAQRQALVGPVQAKVGQRVQDFATERGCAEMKIARTADVAELTSAGARDVTGEFVAWYLASPPA